MTSIAKLKDRARKYEQKEDWRSAIEAYRKVLDSEETEGEIELELGLFNRVGDLYLRLGQVDDAVDYYEKAADKYAASGFFNNAIALCNKALRHRPDRPEIYLKLSRFCHEQGFLTDARRWILDYAERQVKRGHVDAALARLHEFVDSADAPDVRELLAQHLASQGRVDEGVDQLRRAHAEWTRRGDAAGAERVADQARALDPDADVATAPPETADPIVDERDAPHDPGAAGEADEEPTDSGLAGLESHRGGAAGPEALAGPEGLETTSGESDAGAEESPEELGGLETFSVAEPEVEAEDWLEAGADLGPGSSLIPEVDDVEPEPLPLLDVDEEEGPPPEPLPLLDTPPAPDLGDELVDEAEAGEEAEDLEPEDTAELDEVEAPGADERLAAAAPVAEAEAQEPGDDEEVTDGPSGAAEAESAESREEPPPAERLDIGEGLGMGGAVNFGAGWGDLDENEEPLVLDLGDYGGGPGSASHRGEDLMDVDAILDRAKQLVSRGLMQEAVGELRLLSSTDAAPSVFREALLVTKEIVRRNPLDLSVLQRRVEFASRIGDRLLLVETHTDLAEALTAAGEVAKAHAMYQRVLALDPKNAGAREALGDAGGGEDGPVDLEPILEPEDDDPLASMLSQVRANAGSPPPGEDAGAHYDLGLAFKEMGLIDEAINEFQTALRGGEERLKVYEELGQCFMLKGNHAVAVKVLTRALQAPLNEEADLLGVYYHLGQCHEELGQREEARAAYEKVLSIDSNFEDVPSRLARL